MNFIYHFTFIIFTFFVLLKTIFYGFYEIKTQNNKVGGVSVILFSVLVIVFANVIVLLR